jgi:hypothetical protein
VSPPGVGKRRVARNETRVSVGVVRDHNVAPTERAIMKLGRL